MTSPKNSFFDESTNETFNEGKTNTNIFFNVKQFFMKKRQNKDVKNKHVETKANIKTQKTLNLDFSLGTTQNMHRKIEYTPKVLELDKKENWRQRRAVKKIEHKKNNPIETRVRGTLGQSVDAHPIWANLRRNNHSKGASTTGLVGGNSRLQNYQGKKLHNYSIQIPAQQVVNCQYKNGNSNRSVPFRNIVQNTFIPNTWNNTSKSAHLPVPKVIMRQNRQNPGQSQFRRQMSMKIIPQKIGPCRRNRHFRNQSTFVTQQVMTPKNASLFKEHSSLKLRYQSNLVSLKTKFR